MKSARARAASALADVLVNGSHLDEAVARAQGRLEGRDRALFREIAYGVCRRFHELDGLLVQLLDRPLKTRDADVRAVMLCGLYQIRWMRVPEHAAVAESVNTCRALGKHWASGLVNAVLRGYLKRPEALLAALDPAQAAAHPRWLKQALEQAWPAAADSIIAANNTPAPMTVRVNALRETREEWMGRADLAGLAPAAGLLCSSAVILGKAVDVNELPGFAEGAVSVQDEAAQLAAPLLGATPGERVLDACAAPGGKSAHLLEQTPGLQLCALDISGPRAGRIRETLTRLGLSAEVREGDASEPAAWWDEQPFDRILVDAPCSGTGVIRRHPDIKLLRKPPHVEQASALQSRILDALWPLLKPGGVLLYCTCSILPQENDRVIGSFLASTPDAKADPIEADWGFATEHGRQLLPQCGGHDGFFYARLCKTLAL